MNKIPEGVAEHIDSKLKILEKDFGVHKEDESMDIHVYYISTQLHYIRIASYDEYVVKSERFMPNTKHIYLSIKLAIESHNSVSVSRLYCIDVADWYKPWPLSSVDENEYKQGLQYAIRQLSEAIDKLPNKDSLMASLFNTSMELEDLFNRLRSDK